MTSLLNQPAPDFTLLDQGGNAHVLSNYRGQKVLLYFYPKDDTPGCTVEAQKFRDHQEALKHAGVQVLGVSCDSVESHQKFTKKYDLNFPLLADVDKEVVKMYGVWVEKSMYGKKYMGIQRDSFLIDEKGMVVKHYENVKPKDHVAEVLGSLSDVMAA